MVAGECMEEGGWEVPFWGWRVILRFEDGGLVEGEGAVMRGETAMVMRLSAGEAIAFLQWRDMRSEWLKCYMADVAKC